MKPLSRFSHLKLATALLAACFLIQPANADERTGLADILALAKSQELQWRAEQAQFQAQKELKKVGIGALMPSVNLRGSRSRLKQQFDNAYLGVDTNNDNITDYYQAFPDRDYYSTSMTVSANQPLLRLDKWYNYKLALATFDQASASHEEQEQLFLLRVAQAYFEVLRANKTLETARAEETASARQLEQSRERFAVGLSAKTEVHESEAAFDLARVNRIAAASNLAVAREALATLVGVEPATLKDLGAQFAATPPAQGVQAWVEQALAANRRLQAARAARDAASMNTRAKAALHLPAIDLVASRSYNEAPLSGDSTSGQIEQTTSSVGIELTLPLFQGGMINAQRKEARYQAQSAADLYQLEKRRTIQQVRNQWQQLETAAQRVAARQQGIRSAKSALEATETGYEVGTRNIVDVLQAQRLYFAAQRDLAHARYDYALSWLQLRYVAGTLDEASVQEVAGWLE